MLSATCQVSGRVAGDGFVWSHKYMLESLLTVRPWAERSSQSAHFFLSVTRHKHLLSQIVIRTLSHATCDAHSLKAVNVWEMLWILFTLFCVKYIFLWFYHSVGHGMRWRCSFYFRYMTNKMVLTLEVWFPRSDGHLQFVYISCGLGN